MTIIERAKTEVRRLGAVGPARPSPQGGARHDESRPADTRAKVSPGGGVRRIDFSSPCRRDRRGSFKALAWAVGLGLLASGCAAVAPWERGNLAKPHMALDPYPMQSVFRAHTYGSREAASGSASSEGGGCGCY